MTIDELDAIHRQAAWLITKRSGKAALKTLTLGSEGLEKTVSEIADMYQLSDDERRKLMPVIADDIHGGIASAVNVARTAAGLQLPAIDSAETSKSARQGQLAAAATALVTIGPQAARAHPVIAAATVAFAFGSAGWFAYHAQAFNAAAYDLVRAKFGFPAAEPVSAKAIDRSKEIGKAVFGRVKTLAKRKPAAGSEAP